ncbi:MAG: hypothetical protein NUW01_09705, partial [Gemmatimonadaceae bacterium]|nr:hypothetical protein [Gemmatimonadaceae bacterium]
MALTPEEELAQLQSALAAPPPGTVGTGGTTTATPAAPAAPAPAPAAPTSPAPTTTAAAPAPLPQGVPTYAPPPPPPPTPSASALPGKIADYASNWMQTPNRYLSELATTTRAAGDARLKAAEKEGLRGIEEWAASRGLVGSNL